VTKLLLAALLVIGCAPRHLPRPPPAVDPSARVDVLVALTWNAAANKVERRLGGESLADGESLEQRLVAVAPPGGRIRPSDVVVTIAAPAQVPWAAVVEAINACKKAGLEHVEFDLGY
jgi:biopolymer transport protein ExbD